MKYFFAILICLSGTTNWAQDTIVGTPNGRGFSIVHGYGTQFYTSFKNFEENVFPNGSSKFNRFGTNIFLGIGHNYKEIHSSFGIRTNYVGSFKENSGLDLQLLQFDVSASLGYNVARQFYGGTIEPIMEVGLSFSRLQLTPRDTILYLYYQGIQVNNKTPFTTKPNFYLAPGMKHTFVLNKKYTTWLFVKYQFKWNSTRYLWKNDDLPGGADIPLFRSNGILLSVGLIHYLKPK